MFLNFQPHVQMYDLIKLKKVLIKKESLSASIQKFMNVQNTVSKIFKRIGSPREFWFSLQFGKCCCATGTAAQVRRHDPRPSNVQCTGEQYSQQDRDSG